MSLSVSCHNQLLQDFPHHTPTVKSKQSLVIWLLPVIVPCIYNCANTLTLCLISWRTCHTHSSRKQPIVIHLKLFTLHYRERKVLERHIIILTHDPNPCASGCQAAVHMFPTGLWLRATLAGLWQEISRLSMCESVCAASRLCHPPQNLSCSRKPPLCNAASARHRA